MRDVEEIPVDNKWDTVFGILAEAHPNPIAVVEPVVEAEVIPFPMRKVSGWRIAGVALLNAIDPFADAYSRNLPEMLGGRNHDHVTASQAVAVAQLGIGSLLVGLSTINSYVLQGAPGDAQNISKLVIPAMFLFGIGVCARSLMELKKTCD